MSPEAHYLFELDKGARRVLCLGWVEHATRNQPIIITSRHKHKRATLLPHHFHPFSLLTGHVITEAGYDKIIGGNGLVE